MERKIASIQRVKTVDNILHPADGSETTLARISFENIAWQCVAKRGEFAPGDFAIYIEISTVVPEHPVFEFLRSKKFKVKTVRLCGVLSQGLALPLETLEQFLPKEHGWLTFNPGDDVSEIIGVTRYEPPVDAKINGGGAYRAFPEFIPKTDELRIQSIPHILNLFEGQGVIATLKHDGTSATYFYDSETDSIRVCSRNTEKMEKDDSVYWQVLDLQPEIEAYCRQFPSYVLQGEITGPGIQKNRMERKQLRFTAFNIFDRDIADYIPHAFASVHCELYGVPFVEEIEEWEEFSGETVESILKLAEGKYPGTENEREGIVLRLLFEDKFSYEIGSRVSCKAINNRYLESGGE
jgi:RNA ligase (TIGR02306 family)